MNKIKLSDYVTSFLENEGVKDIFLLSGGGCIHLLDSIAKSDIIQYHCCLHEQAVTMATEAYARVKESLGVSLVTTGPGGTNAITGVAGSWMDSVPHLVISGQSYLNQTIGNSGLRQLGVQEINITDIVKPITKYSVMISDAKKIKYHLQKAIYLAKTGRPGPVWLDFPADIQMATINPTELEDFNPAEVCPNYDSKDTLELKVSEVVKLLENSKKPVIYAGQGVKISKSVKDLVGLVERLRIPLLTARNANDMIETSHELFIGRPGMWGDRAGNFSIQNSDLLIAIGTRLSIPQIGYDHKDFARNAKKVIVDIDKAELNKKTISPDIAIHCNAKDFILELKKELTDKYLNIEPWLKQCCSWKNKYPVVLPEYKNQKEYVNPYYLIDVLSEVLREGDITLTDMGLSFQCTHQGFKIKKGQKVITSSGLASMGYGLPAAIGACIANDKNRVICISGDGGLQMNIQELQTMVYKKLPIKLFVLNNGGYLTIKQTQEYSFQRLAACDPSCGVSFPDLSKIAKAYGIKYKKIGNQHNLKQHINGLINHNGPIVCEIIMDPNQTQAPMAKNLKNADGTIEKKPLEDMFPYLDRAEFEDITKNCK